MLDENDQVIRPPTLWKDGRTTEECTRLNDLPVIEWTGNLALTVFTAPKVLCIKNHEPQYFSRICKIILP